MENTYNMPPEPKDITRLESMVKKANDDYDKIISLAQTMAKAITHYDKAVRRAAAAEQLMLFDVAEIFIDRAYKLNPWWFKHFFSHVNRE